MQNAFDVFNQWEKLSPPERAFFAGLVEGYNRAPIAQAAPKPKKVGARKPKAPPAAAALAAVS